MNKNILIVFLVMIAVMSTFVAAADKVFVDPATITVEQTKDSTLRFKITSAEKVSSVEILGSFDTTITPFKYTPLFVGADNVAWPANMVIVTEPTGNTFKLQASTMSGAANWLPVGTFPVLKMDFKGSTVGSGEVKITSAKINTKAVTDIKNAVVTVTAQSACKDECTPVNSFNCSQNNLFVFKCGNYDSDSCLEFSTGEPCAAGKTCDAASGTCITTTQDKDKDGILDSADNCKGNPNPDQADNDKDSIGDICDKDDDGDGILDRDDNCPLLANPGQEDGDKDNLGDACDTTVDPISSKDKDGDGVLDRDDECLGVGEEGFVDEKGCLKAGTQVGCFRYDSIVEIDEDDPAQLDLFIKIKEALKKGMVYQKISGIASALQIYFDTLQGNKEN